MKKFDCTCDSELWLALLDETLEDTGAVDKLIRKREKQLAKLDAVLASQNRKVQRLSVNLIARSAARLKAAMKGKDSMRRETVLRREAIVLCEVLGYFSDALGIEQDGGPTDVEQ